MKREEQKGNSRQQEILKETMYLIRKGGLQAVTMKKVADRVGIKEASAYRYFPDKTQLLIGIIGGIKKILLKQLYKLQASDEAPTIKLQKIVTHHIQTVLKLNGLPIVFMAEVASSKKLDLTKHIKQILDEYRQIIEDLIIEINPDIEQPALVEYSTVLIGMSASLAIQVRVGTKVDLKQTAFETVLPLVIDGIANNTKKKNRKKQTKYKGKKRCSQKRL